MVRRVGPPHDLAVVIGRVLQGPQLDVRHRGTGGGDGQRQGHDRRRPHVGQSPLYQGLRQRGGVDDQSMPRQRGQCGIGQVSDRDTGWYMHHSPRERLVGGIDPSRPEHCAVGARQLELVHRPIVPGPRADGPFSGGRGA